MQNEIFYWQRTKICVGYLKSSLCVITVTVLRVHTIKWEESALQHQNASIFLFVLDMVKPNQLNKDKMWRHFVYHIIQRKMQQQQEVLFPCSKCGENVSDDQRAISCDECGSWTRQVCVCREISRKRYERIIQRQEEFKFVCIKCRNLESTGIPK